MLQDDISTSAPFFSAFMVRNHSEQKGGTARMVINYTRLTEHLEFDGYYIPKKHKQLTKSSLYYKSV